ncbi:MAG: N-acetyltransferase [Cyanobium sp.]
MLPFRSQPATPRLREGYRLVIDESPPVEALNRLRQACGEPPRRPELWQRALARSHGQFSVLNRENRLCGYVRITSDQALNANLWDLLSDPADPAREEVITALLQAALMRLRRELSGCSVSVSAPPEALAALSRAGFVVDPGGIRAMGLQLGES